MYTTTAPTFTFSHIDDDGARVYTKFVPYGELGIGNICQAVDTAMEEQYIDTILFDGIDVTITVSGGKTHKGSAFDVIELEYIRNEQGEMVAYQGPLA